MNKFGELLKEKRMQNKLTQSSLAEMLNVSDRTVSKWETGNGYPNITMLNTIANCLNTSVSELMDSEDIKVINSVKQNPSDEQYRAKFRKKMIVAMSLLLTAILYLMLPILRFNIPDGAIGAIGEDSDTYVVVAIVLTIFISLCYLVSFSLFTYMIIQYRKLIKSKFHNFTDKNIIKKYLVSYSLLTLAMIVIVIIALNIEI
ncbi:helix-turn-helix domain-containing protein [Liberiplasma polymorphum]|uniref:helix-turn-helix domain-containing protein n=1 Tax=Liberiplasma polymorphum TaxID=3374570 RepID=UPI00377696B5